MRTYFNHLTESIQSEMQSIDIEGCNISLEESVRMINFLKDCLSDLRKFFLSQEEISIQDEIVFFKEMKPEVLSLLLYFNKVHSIELKRPNGSNDTQREYFQNGLSSLTYFFERNLEFYQYYRSKATYLDNYYFVRNKMNLQLCSDSSYLDKDPDFSTGFDYKVAKVLCNEMLRIYLNRQLHLLERKQQISKIKTVLSDLSLRWTGSKSDAVEWGYGLLAVGVLNNGNANIKEIMTFIEAAFDIDLGDYYRTYLALKNRKKDRTAFFTSIIEQLQKRMDADDM